MSRAPSRYHHLSWLRGLELFEAAFIIQISARHAHEGFDIGAIAQGAQNGHAVAGCVRNRTLYVSEAAVRAMLARLAACLAGPGRAVDLICGRLKLLRQVS